MLREQKFVYIVWTFGLVTTIYLLLISTSIRISSSNTLVIKLALPLSFRDKTFMSVDNGTSIQNFYTSEDEEITATQTERLKRRKNKDLTLNSLSTAATVKNFDFRRGRKKKRKRIWKYTRKDSKYDTIQKRQFQHRNDLRNVINEFNGGIKKYKQQPSSKDNLQEDFSDDGLDVRGARERQSYQNRKQNHDSLDLPSNEQKESRYDDSAQSRDDGLLDSNEPWEKRIITQMSTIHPTVSSEENFDNIHFTTTENPMNNFQDFMIDAEENDENFINGLFDFHQQQPGDYLEEVITEMEHENMVFEPSQFGEKKVILMMTPAFESRVWYDTPLDYKMTDKNGNPCPESRCMVTYDRSQFAHSDLVFFHGRDVRDLNSKSLHKLRKLAKNQIWVWAFMESPLNLFYNPKPYDNLFDWTVSYKKESDFWTPYHHIFRVKEIKRRRKDIAKSKSGLVAAVQSSCDPFRMNVLNEMKKFLRVDVYGKCGYQFPESIDLEPCERFSEECEARLKKYKFIMALENSYCDEYVTEKYFKNALLSGIVPIVALTPKFVNKDSYFIPGSYINMVDFNSTEELTIYLQYLNKNNTAYNKFFTWRDKYIIRDSHHRACMVCQKLWDMDKKRQRFVPSTTRLKLSEFWSEDSCEVWDKTPPKVLAKLTSGYLKF